MCIYCKVLWDNMHYWLFPKILNIIEFSKNDIIFKRKEKTLENVLNVIIIMYKFFIHEC